MFQRNRSTLDTMTWLLLIATFITYTRASSYDTSPSYDDDTSAPSAADTLVTYGTPAPLPNGPTSYGYSPSGYESISSANESSIPTEQNATTQDTPLTHSDYSIRPLNVSHALFEHVAPVHFYTQHWKILTSVKLPDFSESLELIGQYDEMVRNVCAKWNGTALQNHCRNSAREIGRLTQKIRSTNEELRHMTAPDKTRRRRTKRAVAEAVDGNSGVARSLYLALEDVGSLDVVERIGRLEQDGNSQFDLLKEQTSLVRSTFNAVNQTVSRLLSVQRENDNSIEGLLKRLRAIRNDFRLGSSDVEARLTLIELIQLITLEMTGVMERQNEILSIVTTTEAGRLHPMVLGVDQLNRVYRNMTSRMGFEEVLVGTEDIPKMIRLDSAQQGQNLLVQLEVPMIKTADFQLFRAYALPHFGKYPDGPVLEGRYLAVNDEDKTYVVLSEDELKGCSATETEFGADQIKYFCRRSTPLYTKASGSCIISLFQQRNIRDTGDCVFRSQSYKDSVIKMTMPSTWLWLAESDRDVQITCDDTPDVHHVRIPAQSIVQLNGMCELETDRFRLESENTLFRNVTVIESKDMSDPSNAQAFDSLAAQSDFISKPVGAHDLDQEPIRISQPQRNYHRWLNANGRTLMSLVQNLRRVDAYRKQNPLPGTDLNDGDGGTSYTQIMLTVGRAVVRIVRFAFQMWEQYMGDDDDLFSFL